MTSPMRESISPRGASPRIPRPVSRPHPPIWIGGNTAAARQRVAQYGDGWCPFAAPARLAQTAGTAVIDSAEAPRPPASTTCGDAAMRRAGTCPLSTSPSATSTAAARPATTSTPTPTSAAWKSLPRLGVTWVQVGLRRRQYGACTGKHRPVPVPGDRRGLNGLLTGRTVATMTRPSTIRRARFITEHVTDEVLAPGSGVRRKLRRASAFGAGRSGLSGRGLEAGVRRWIQPGSPTNLQSRNRQGPYAVVSLGHHVRRRAVCRSNSRHRNSRTWCCPEC